MFTRRAVLNLTAAPQRRAYVQLQSQNEQTHFSKKIVRAEGAKNWFPHAPYVMSREKQLFDMWKHEAKWEMMRGPLALFFGVAFFFKA